MPRAKTTEKGLAEIRAELKELAKMGTPEGAPITGAAFGRLLLLSFIESNFPTMPLKVPGEIPSFIRKDMFRINNEVPNLDSKEMVVVDFYARLYTQINDCYDAVRNSSIMSDIAIDTITDKLQDVIFLIAESAAIETGERKETFTTFEENKIARITELSRHYDGEDYSAIGLVPIALHMQFADAAFFIYTYNEFIKLCAKWYKMPEIKLLKFDTKKIVRRCKNYNTMLTKARTDFDECNVPWRIKERGFLNGALETFDLIDIERLQKPLPEDIVRKATFTHNKTNQTLYTILQQMKDAWKDCGSSNHAHLIKREEANNGR